MAVRRLFGGILVTVGLLAILQNLDFVKLQESQIFSILLLLAGGYGYYAFTRRRQSIWLLSLALALFCWGLGKTADSWQILPISIESSLSILGISLAFVAVFFPTSDTGRLCCREEYCLLFLLLISSAKYFTYIRGSLLS